MFPVLEELQDHLVSYLAKHLPEVVTADLAGFCALSSCAIVQLLLSPFLVCSGMELMRCSLWPSDAAFRVRPFCRLTSQHAPS